MTKQEAIEVLRGLRCKYAELIVDVYAIPMHEPIWENEKIIVSVLETQDPSKFYGKCYCVCDSIRDFRIGCVFGEKEARKFYSRYYFGDVKEIIPK